MAALSGMMLKHQAMAQGPDVQAKSPLSPSKHQAMAQGSDVQVKSPLSPSTCDSCGLPNVSPVSPSTCEPCGLPSVLPSASICVPLPNVSQYVENPCELTSSRDVDHQSGRGRLPAQSLTCEDSTELSVEWISTGEKNLLK